MVFDDDAVFRDFLEGTEDGHRNVGGDHESLFPLGRYQNHHRLVPGLTTVIRPDLSSKDDGRLEDANGEDSTSSETNEC